MVNKNVLKPQEFLDSTYYETISQLVKPILNKLIDQLENTTIKYLIKIRKDGSIALSPDDKPQKNIATICIFQTHVKFKIDKFDLKIYKPEDIDGDLISLLEKKYLSLIKPKRQLSVYIDEELFKKIKEKTKKERVKINDIVVDAIKKSLRDYFLNDKHKEEFSKLIKSAGLDEDEKNKDYSPEYIERKRRLVALFYLISAYQDYYETFGSKITFDRDLKALKGPASVLEQWELGYANGDTALGLGLSILKGKEGGADLFDILSMLNCEGPDNDEIYFLAMNAFKILNGEIVLIKDSLESVKAITFDTTLFIKNVLSKRQ